MRHSKRFPTLSIKAYFSLTVILNEERIRTVLRYLGKSDDSILTPSNIVDYLIANQNRLDQVDRHLRPQNLLCDFCNTRSDFLAKVETRNRDFRKIVEILRLKGQWKINVRKNAQNITSECEFFAHIEHERIKELIEKVYKTDFELFGYDKTIPKCDQSHHLVH